MTAVLNRKTAILAALTLLSALAYQFLFMDPELFGIFMEIRAPKLCAMVIAALCIGGSSLVFQTLINNTIVTPCLLGMNSLYLLIHTALVGVFGAASFAVTDKHLSFVVDLCLMAVVASFIYSYIFKKTKYNVLYVLLIGTVMTTMFTSMQNTIVRAMDPNDYDTLLTTLVASFTNMNSSVLAMAMVLIVALYFAFRKDLALLDVMTLGKQQSISLGIDYDRTVRRLLVFVTLYIAIATALIGPISFMGLITTNIARQYFQTYRHRYLIWGSIFISVVILVAGQTLVERVFTYSIPVSVFITIGGGIYFLYLVLRASKGSI